MRIQGPTRHVWIAGAIAGAALLTASAAWARIHGSVGHYDALISEADHYNSDGVRLRDAVAILRQDRANVHDRGVADDEDEYEPYFATLAGRERFEYMIDAGELSEADEIAIVTGEARVHVDIFPNSVIVTVY